MRSVTFLLTVISLFSLCLMAAGQEVVLPLYEGSAPGSESWDWAEISQPSTDGIARAANVTKPTLTVYAPEPGRRNGMGVVVAPGGGFQHLAIEHEGSEVAEWLRAQGVTVFVLKYRLMRTAGAPSADREELNRRRREAITFAVADGLQAMRIARKNAARFGVDPHRLGILGFSAGGWVAVATALEGREDSRPDFAAPIYAAMPENLTPPPAPMPLFLVHANDDKVVDPLKTSVRLYQVWKQTGASAELHIYAHGGHGFGMRRKGLPTDSWLDRFWEWAQAEQFAGPR